MISKLFRRWISRSLVASHRDRRRSPAFYRPRIETLEERSVLSTVLITIDPTVHNVAESGGVADFLVTRDGGALAHEAYVRYKIGQQPTDTATWFKDYRSLKQSGMLTFKVGETQKHIYVSAFDDNIPEDDETFTVQLTAVAVNRGGHGEIVNPTGRGVIVDNDLDPWVDVAGPTSVAENAARHNFSIELNEADGVTFKKSEKVVLVDYSVNPVSNTLRYGTDIVVPRGQTGRLTFQPGETRKTIQVQIFEDRIAEPNEKFEVRVTPVQNARAGFNLNVQEVTIRDDDDAVVSIRALTEPFGEASEFEGGAGENTVVTFQIVLGERAERDVAVQYLTEDGTARVNDHDYQFKNGQVIFTDGGNKGDAINVTFTIVGDSKKEKTESFNVELVESPLNRIVRKSVKVKIVNDD